MRNIGVEELKAVPVEEQKVEIVEILCLTMNIGD